MNENNPIPPAGPEPLRSPLPPAGEAPQHSPLPPAGEGPGERARPEPFVRAPYYAEDEISLTDILRVIHAQRRLILAITGVSTVLATVLAFVMTPVYRSEALLIPVA